jgi:hypothetical protein
MTSEYRRSNAASTLPQAVLYFYLGSSCRRICDTSVFIFLEYAADAVRGLIVDGARTIFFERERELVSYSTLGAKVIS